MLEIFAQLMRGPEPVTRDRLGMLGGNPRFRPPEPDADCDRRHGIAPKPGERTALEPPWYQL